MAGPGYWKSLAICLRVVDYGDTSQIVAFLSRERGRISTIAKGAKRRGSRFAGALEPLTLCEIVGFKGRETASLHTLCEADVRDTFRGARRSLRHLHAAAYVIEILREAVPEEQPLPEVFDLALGALRRIAAPGDLDPAAVTAFEARLLELLGLFPRLDACAECGAPAGLGLPSRPAAPASGPSVGSAAGAKPAPRPAGRAAFSARFGGVLCAACREEKDRSAREVSSGTLQALDLLGRDPEKSAHLRMPSGQQAELRALLNAYLTAALERELRLAKYQD